MPHVAFHAFLVPEFSSPAFSTPCNMMPIIPVSHFPVSHFQRPHHRDLAARECADDVCNFLLVINSNFDPILHRFWVIGWKLRIFPTPLSYNALARGEPFGTSGSPFFAKTRVFVLSVGEDFVILARFSLSASVCRTYRQTDGQTDIQIVANTGLA